MSKHSAAGEKCMFTCVARKTASDLCNSNAQVLGFLRAVMCTVPVPPFIRLRAFSTYRHFCQINRARLIFTVVWMILLFILQPPFP